MEDEQIEQGPVTTTYLERLDQRRAESLARKKEAEVLMQESAKKVHTYQKEFEVNQKAFLQAVSELRDLDQKSAALGRPMLDAKPDIRDSSTESNDATKARRLAEYNNVLADGAIHWHDTASETGSELSR